MGILPIAVAMNAASKFNNLGQWRNMIAIGIIQTLGFLASFLILVPYYGSIGAAYSILIAYSASAVYAVSLFERAERRYLMKSIVAIIIGCVSGYVVNFTFEHSLPTVVSSVVATSVVLLALRNTSISELRHLVVTMMNPRGRHV
jgi:hypothetical protein